MSEPSVDSKRASPRRPLGLVTTVLLSGWVACSVYDQELLDSASGGGAGRSALGGAGGGSSGGGGDGAQASSGSGGASGTAASAGSSAAGKGSGGEVGATGGNAGKGSGGAAGKGGSSNGKGGSSGTGVVAMAGEGGEAGESACPMGDCCPDDDTKLEPGVCGCGVDEASCAAVKDSLVNRYSFDGTGVTVTDTKGGADGTVLGTGALLDGSGALTLAGGYVPAETDPNEQYVELPPGCLDGLTDATFDAWIDWAPADGTNAQSSWQRIFDFGESAASGVGTYIFSSPRVTNATGPARVSFTSSMGSANQIYANGPALEGGPHHFTVVVDDTNDHLSLYVDGLLGSTVLFAGALSDIQDSSCYLGRSHFTDDPYFAGALDEFRIHAIAFSAADVAFSEASGPNPAFLQPEAKQLRRAAAAR